MCVVTKRAEHAECSLMFARMLHAMGPEESASPRPRQLISRGIAISLASTPVALLPPCDALMRVFAHAHAGTATPEGPLRCSLRYPASPLASLQQLQVPAVRKAALRPRAASRPRAGPPPDARHVCRLPGERHHSRRRCHHRLWIAFRDFSVASGLGTCSWEVVNAALRPQ